MCWGWVAWQYECINKTGLGDTLNMKQEIKEDLIGAEVESDMDRT